MGKGTQPANKMKTLCLSSEHPKIEEVASQFKKRIKPKELRMVYEAICQRGEQGVTAAELRHIQATALSSQSDMLQILDALLGTNMVVKTGVVGLRIVATDNAEAWKLSSFKLLRIQKENAQEFSKSHSFNLNPKFSDSSVRLCLTPFTTAFLNMYVFNRD